VKRILNAIGDCNKDGDMVAPFDHVLFRYYASDAKHHIVLTKAQAANLAMQVLYLVLPKDES
jgi:hypothetical protein